MDTRKASEAHACLMNNITSLLSVTVEYPDGSSFTGFVTHVGMYDAELTGRSGDMGSHQIDFRKAARIQVDLGRRGILSFE